MKLLYTTTAVKQLKKLQKQDQKKIVRKISALTQNPFVGKKLKGPLNKLFSLRAWPYRIIYQIHEKVSKITILTVCHRKDVYR